MAAAPNQVLDQTAMLALSVSQGDYCFRVDTLTTWRLTGTDPSDLGDWTEKGLPPGVTVYEDSVTGDWMIARQGEAETILAE